MRKRTAGIDSAPTLSIVEHQHCWLVPPDGFDRVGAMDFDPLTGRLYATGVRPADRTPVLITIDAATGVGTEVGPTGIRPTIAGMSFR